MKKTDRFWSFFLCTSLVLVLTQNTSSSKEIDMKPHWDDTIPLENPHKGWYHHFPDNHINKYIIKEDAHLLEFPGMDHLYIRLAWAYLEPREGEFNWDVIDSIINKWIRHGLKIAFRISCRETGTDRIEQQFATPKWVMEAGAKGDFYLHGKKVDSNGPWEPVFNDPIYLAKLENFLQAFAARYDGKPWLRYVDIGSIGDWGEGHTHSGSRLEYGYGQRKIHVDLYLKYFKKTQLVTSDDFVYSVSDLADREKLHNYMLDNGISYRDDSILVNGYFRSYADQYTVRSPEFFADAYRNTPTVFELEHYSAVRRSGNWLGKEGSSLREYGKGKSGVDMFRGALQLLHATYIGYHGDAHQWLSENPELTMELLNRCGYWYFLHQVNIPDTIQSGTDYRIQMKWENRGVAPAYHPYRLRILFDGPKKLYFDINAGNQKWKPNPPDGIYTESYPISILQTVPTGQYTIKIKLYSTEENRDVFLALDPTLLDEENYYTITNMRIE